MCHVLMMIVCLACYVLCIMFVYIILLVLWLLYIVTRRAAPVVTAAGPLAAVILNCPHITTTYVPPPHCLTGALHSVIGNFRKRVDIKYTRYIVKLPDAGSFALDYVNPVGIGNKDVCNTVLCLPGLTGCSRDAYVTHFASIMLQHGWRVVVMNARGLGGQPLTSSRVYCAADKEDIRACINVVTDYLFPDSVLYGVGFSLGSLVLSNYVGDSARLCRLRGAVCLACPYDLTTGFNKLYNNWFSRRVFHDRLASRLRKYAVKYWDILATSPAALDKQAVFTGKSIQDYERGLVCPMWGFRDVQDYYDHVRISNRIQSAARPIVYINALDDPFVDAASAPNMEHIINNNNIATVTTRYGGHLAWLDSMWSPYTTASFGEVLASEILINMAKNVVE